MNRRGFFKALGVAVAAATAPKRIYSFLWDNPLVESAYEFRMMAYPVLMASSPAFIGRAIITAVDREAGTITIDSENQFGELETIHFAGGLRDWQDWIVDDVAQKVAGR